MTKNNFSSFNYNLLIDIENNKDNNSKSSNYVSNDRQFNNRSLYLSAIDQEIETDEIFNKNKLVGKDNHSNKFVNENTLNSYLSITDLQNEANDSIDICRNNINKINERSIKITGIEEKSDHLSSNASKFKYGSLKLKYRMYINLIFNLLGIFFFLILIIYLITKLS